MHDPYWYEGIVGLLSAVDMLSPDTDIESVSFQKSGVKGLDDVVVAHASGRTVYTQVKHTRAEHTLTFGDLVAKTNAEGAEKGGDSLLQHLAKAWLEARKECDIAEARIFTNRPIGDRPYKHRPSLSGFLAMLAEQLKHACDFSGISFSQDWQEAWAEWTSELACLGSDERVYEFLTVFRVIADQPDLDELGVELRSRLRNALGVSEAQASELATRLEAALKKWTTSLRSNNAITAEDIWKELGGAEEFVGAHAIPPPAPFFPSREGFLRDVASALATSTSRVVFMTGEPGCGKTSVVSALANRSDPIIDLRYHAYRPIAPDMTELPLDTGETTSAESLWGDLLIQLRQHLAGRLAHHRVPLRTSFLSAEDRRSEVLRLASALAEERGRRVVIAIDGIDHAARADRPERLQFLDSLPAPEHVPENVCVMVVGQSPDAWPAYPHWLREPNDSVEVHRIPPIDESDVRTLLADRLPTEPVEVHVAIALIIGSLTRYNTLSVVFAVEEAVVEPQPQAFQTRLRERALESSLRRYYDGIWGNALGGESTNAHMRERMAATVALTREHLTGELLTSVFLNESKSSQDWNDILRNLRPLLVEDASGFRVLHNDVRVHLTLHAGADRSRLREISGLFLRHYEGDECSQQARHSHLFEYARLAGTLENASRAFTPHWVAEAAALDRPITELHQQARLALQGLLPCEDWHLIHSVVCGIGTLQQLERSDTWIGRSRPVCQASPVLTSECSVLQPQFWNEKTLPGMLSDAEILADEAPDRARALVLRWLSGTSPRAYASILDENRIRKFPHTPNRRLGQNIEDALEKWGELAHKLQLTPQHFCGHEQSDPEHNAQIDAIEHLSEAPAGNAGDENETQTSDDKDETQYAAMFFAAGWLRSAARQSFGTDWARSLLLAMGLGCRQRDVASALDELVQRRKWLEVVYTLRHINPKAQLVPALRVRSMVLAITSGHGATISRWVAGKLDTTLGRGGFSNSGDDNLLACCGFAFTVAWLEPTLHTSSVRDQFLDLYLGGTRNSRTRVHVAILLRAAAIAGRTWRLCSMRPAAPLTGTDAGDLAKSMRALLNPDVERPTDVPFGYMEVAGRLLRLMVAGVESDPGFRSELVSIAKEHARTFPTGDTAEVVWGVLQEDGELGLLNDWWNHWCGEFGEAWSCSLGDRNGIVRTLVSLANGAGWSALADAALERLGWGRVGYSGHKDYSIYEPMEWFKILSQRDAAAWRDLGIRLLAVSEHASEVGDNRLGFDTRMTVADAMTAEGISAVRTLASANSTRNATDWLGWESYMFFHWLIQCTAREDLTRHDLLHMWCLGIGIMWWEFDSDYADLAALRDGIIERARLSGYNDIDVAIEKLGPLEFAAKPKKERRETRLWFESSDSIVPCAGDPNKFVQSVVNAPAGQPSIEDYIAAVECFEKCSVSIRRDTKLAGDLLTRFLERRDQDFPTWSFDGAARTVKTLLPHIDDEARLELARDVIRKAVEQPANYRFFGASEDLGLLCLYRGETLPTDEIARFAERQIDTHWNWIQGFGHLPPVSSPILNSAAVDASSDSWERLAVDVLSGLLSSEATHAVAASLRGLFSLAEIGLATPHIANIMENSKDSRVRYWWLLLCERLLVELPHPDSDLRATVTRLLDDANLLVAVQAWVTLARFNRRQGEAPPAWPFATKKGAPAPTPGGGQRLIRSNDSTLGGMTFTSGGRSVFSRISRLGAITGLDVRDLESRVAARGWGREPSRRPARPRGNATALVFADNSAQDVLLDEVYRDLANGRFDSLDPVTVAEAVLPSDDPFVLLRTARVQEGGAWPPPDRWGNTDRSPGPEVGERLREILLEDGIEETEVVLGGAISSYDLRTDYGLFHTLVWMNAPGDLADDWFRSTPTARTFSFVMNSNGVNLARSSTHPFTLLAGGINEFTVGGLRVLPGYLWASLGWRPAPPSGSGLRWTTPTGATIRFESLQGPPRSEAQDAHHRQPLLHRWVGPRSVIDEVVATLGGAVVPRSNFEQVPFHAPRR
jgi:hypothetical protein